MHSVGPSHCIILAFSAFSGGVLGRKAGDCRGGKIHE